MGGLLFSLSVRSAPNSSGKLLVLRVSSTFGVCSVKNSDRDSPLINGVFTGFDPKLRLTTLHPLFPHYFEQDDLLWHTR